MLTVATAFAVLAVAAAAYGPAFPAAGVSPQSGSTTAAATTGPAVAVQDTGAVGAPVAAVPGGRLAAELRGGAAVGEVAAALSGPQWTPGASWRAVVSWRLAGPVEAYAGYGASSFGCSEGLCQDRDITFTSRGATAGIQVSAGPLWVRGGVIRHALHSRWQTGDARHRTTDEATAGWELGGGVSLPLPARLPFGAAAALTPGVRYATHGGGSDASGSGAIGHATADLGVRMVAGRRR
jgi:hypothetical protein